MPAVCVHFFIAVKLALGCASFRINGFQLIWGTVTRSIRGAVFIEEE